MKLLYVISLLFLTVNGSNICNRIPCSPTRLYADIVSIIDSSSSMDNGLFDGVKQFLTDIASNVTLGSNEDNTQMAFYTFSKDGKSYGTLKNGNNNNSVLSTINSLTLDDYADRSIDQALSLEEDEVTTGNGLRQKAKKILIIFSGNSFTGVMPSTNNILGKLQSKYDHIIAIGVGYDGVKNNYDELHNIAGDSSQLFFTPSPDQLRFIYPAVLQTGCSNYMPAITTPKPTTAPTQAPSVSCQVSSLSYDIYLLIDNSNNLNSDTFGLIKKQLYNFISPYSIGTSTQVAVFGIAINTQEYYTSFENSQMPVYVTSAINNMAQESNNGQAIALSLNVIQNNIFKKIGKNGKSQLIVYVTDNTNFDSDPTNILSSLTNQYGVKRLVIRTDVNASMDTLTRFSGAQNCVYDVSTQGTSGVAAWLQDATCRKNFCV
ncbi:von Willebrand factor, type A domain-containing protein [Strongyloides ratti]|uniref:von Willebrand factor, type A domain-containing protein n=1 Tax=Strongyloides ratti TaxID=34506 RepID=A0A090LBR5_STRRB|nr:von Willebrand factor, type A domain-containing protein [Strongyloides ratti]CEF64985.1 von Willebrand factor, type A domain-containing protein [Strongyloides ratti]